MDHRAIIEGLGGNKVLAEALQVRENAVCHWKVRGIPAKYWPRIANFAQSIKKDIYTIDTLMEGA